MWRLTVANDARTTHGSNFRRRDRRGCFSSRWITCLSRGAHDRHTCDPRVAVATKYVRWGDKEKDWSTWHYDYSLAVNNQEKRQQSLELFMAFVTGKRYLQWQTFITGSMERVGAGLCVSVLCIVPKPFWTFISVIQFDSSDSLYFLFLSSVVFFQGVYHFTAGKNIVGKLS